MDDKIARLILDELFSSLEALETQSAAAVQFLKEKGGASEGEFAKYLEEAARASSVKRRAARARIDHLISGISSLAKKSAEQDAAKQESGDREAAAQEPQGATKGQELKKEKAAENRKEDERTEQQEPEAKEAQDAKPEAKVHPAPEGEAKQSSPEAAKSALPKDKERPEPQGRAAPPINQSNREPRPAEGNRSGKGDQQEPETREQPAGAEDNKRKPAGKSTAK